MTPMNMLITTVTTILIISVIAFIAYVALMLFVTIRARKEYKQFQKENELKMAEFKQRQAEMMKRWEEKSELKAMKKAAAKDFGWQDID